jgi:hypothetical protein
MVRLVRRLLGACCVFFHLVSAGLAAEPAAAKPVPDARFGNVLYRTPDRAAWTPTDAADRRVFSAKVPPPDFCTLTVFTGGKLEGEFTAAFERAVAASLREHAAKLERDGGVQTGTSAEGFPVLQRTVVAEAPEFHTYHWFLAANSGGRFDLIAFEASSEEMFKRYGEAAADFFYSVKMANSLPKPAPVAADVAVARPAAAPRETAAAPAAAAAFGPIKVGDRVEIPWAGGWVPGIVQNVEGLTYFVRYADGKSDGAHDDFFTLNLIRPPGGPKTFAETFRDTAPDPDGGPLPLGGDVEYYDGRWLRARIARRLGEQYVVFTDQPGTVTEKWVMPDQIRRVGDTSPLSATRPAPRKPATAADIRPGDLVEAKPRKGFWGQLTVLTRSGDSYFVKIGPNSGLSMRGWVDLSHMRPVGAKDPFAAEDLSFFVGRWRLTGDSFQIMVDRKVSGGKVTETYENNSGAGRDAGGIVINANGTYQLSNTVVYHDGQGRWERNPNQDEGGILLRGADDKGQKDCLMTNHLDGYGYLQGSIRGPGKWCTRVK